MKKEIRNVILRLHEKYAFLFDEKSEITFDEVMDKLIEASKDEPGITRGLQAKGSNFFKDYMHRELCLFESSEIINKFINKKLISSSNKEECIEQLDILDLFFKSVDYILTDEMAYTLFLENDKINNILRTIIYDPYESTEIKVSQSIKTLFDVYCERHSIENTFAVLKEDTANTIGIKNFNYEAVTAREENELFQKYHQNIEKNKEEIIIRNLNFVKYLCRMYKMYDMPQDDLFQEGVLGLIKAVEKFDYTKGYRFSTYATKHICSKIEKYIAENITPFSTTKSLGMHLKKFYRNKAELQEKLKKSPTVRELSFYTGLPKEIVCEYEKMLYLSSIDNIYYNINTEEFISSVELKYDVHKFLKENDLTELEMKVVKGRYGFNKDYIKTLSQIGEELNITKMCVKQKEDTAFLKMRNQQMLPAMALHMDNEKNCMQNIDTYWMEAYQKVSNDPYSYFATVYHEVAAKRKIK